MLRLLYYNTGEAWDYKRRHLVAQAHVRRKAAKTVMKQADAIQREDAIFEDPPEDKTPRRGIPSCVGRDLLQGLSCHPQAS